MAEKERTSKVRRGLESWWALAVFAGLLWLGFRLLSHDGVVSALVSAVVYGGLMSVSYALRRRRVSRVTGVDAEDLSRQVRRGEVPEDPEQRRLMRQLVRWQLTRLHSMRRAIPAFLLLFAMVVANAVLWFATGRLVAGLCWLIGGLAFLGWMLWMRRRAQARLTRTDRRLRAFDHGQPA